MLIIRRDLDANERMKLLIARMNEMRRNAKGEIFRLKQSMITMKGSASTLYCWCPMVMYVFMSVYHSWK